MILISSPDHIIIDNTILPCYVTSAVSRCKWFFIFTRVNIGYFCWNGICNVFVSLALKIFLKSFYERNFAIFLRSVGKYMVSLAK